MHGAIMKTKIPSLILVAIFSLFLASGASARTLADDWRSLLEKLQSCQEVTATSEEQAPEANKEEEEEPDCD